MHVKCVNFLIHNKGKILNRIQLPTTSKIIKIKELLICTCVIFFYIKNNIGMLKQWRIGVVTATGC